MRVRGNPGLAADAWVVVLTIVLLWPQHRIGYGLGHDMVFTPKQPLNADSLGLGSGSPRAVPLDALVALSEHLLDGAVVGRFALAVPLLFAGWGSRRLFGSATLPAQLLVAGLAVWNPFVVERLALGHWALLWAYGALPWLVRAATRVRTDSRPAAFATLTCAVAACSITPTGGLIGALTAVALTASRSVRRMLAVGALVVVLQLPWLLPALASTAAATSDPRAVSAFGARSERQGGTLLSLLGLGGIWDSDVTPASRAGLLGYVTTALVVLVLFLGGADAARRLGTTTTTAHRLGAVAGCGVVLAAASTLPGGAAVLRWAIRVIPGAGLLRDGQKWLLPFVLVAVLCAGAVGERLSRVRWRVPVAVGAAAIPLLVLPDGARTLSVPLDPVRYPADWSAVAGQIRGGGGVLVLPFASYRQFPWAPGRSVLDPAPRLLDASVLVNDQLVISGESLAGEDPRAARISRILADGKDLDIRLAQEGFRWVVIERDTAGPRLPDLAALRVVIAGPAVELLEVPGSVARHDPSTARRALVTSADLLAAGLVLVAFGFLATKRCYRLVQFRNTPTTEDV
jgi:hypothetical protein